MGSAKRWITFASLVFPCVTLAAAPADYFKITVVDEATGRGVPLVELKTVNNIRYVTDSNGIIAFFEPGLMDKTVYFGVSTVYKGRIYWFWGDTNRFHDWV